MQYFERHQGGERAILVHCTLKECTDNQNDLAEFRLLAHSANAEVLDEITSTLQKPHAKLFIGTGKAEEIAQKVAQHKADIVLFNHTLSPSQERNLEKILQCRVIDRTGLILDIFAQRARTYEGKLQVELAQLSHLSTRLVRGWTHLERQKGGIGLRGPGETQLETDRRLLQIRVGQLKEKLAKVKKTRQIGRSGRQKSSTPTVSLVGYTNAGKSTLFNYLTGDSIYAADQLFATLDPTLRQIHWPGVGKVVLADTVGFVQNLPHELVESFHATLEETLQADLLLHVIDSSSPSCLEQIDAVHQVLSAIQADAPVLLVHNKIDQTQETPAITYVQHIPHKVFVSAHTGAGMPQLQKAVQELLVGALHTFHLTLSHQDGAFVHALHTLNAIVEQSYATNGQIQLTVVLSVAKLKQLVGEHHLNIHRILPPEECALLLPKLEDFEQSAS